MSATGVPVRAPVRVRRRRTTGWSTPTDPHGRPALYVGRGTRWGNPHRVDPAAGRTAAWAVAAYAADLHAGRLPVTPDEARRVLAGRDLSCWCPPTTPCHADVLLTEAARTH